MSVDEQRRNRYFNIANLVIFLIGLSLVILSVRIEPSGPEWQGILLNIGSDLIVVSVVFFAGRLLLLDPQRDLEERLRSIEAQSLETVKTIHAMATPDAESLLRDRQAMHSISLAGRARQIWACGYSLITLIRENESVLADRLSSGCSLQFLFLNPNAEATIWLDALITPRPGELLADIRSSLARLERVAASVAREARGLIEVRLLNVLPNCSIVVVDRNKPEGWVQVGLYPSFHQVPVDTSRPHIVLTRPAGAWYQFFCNQFQRLWDDPRYSVPYELASITHAMDG